MLGKIALVTGGSRGIGRAISLKLAEKGCDVAVLYAGNTAAAEETKALIEAKGVRAIAVRCDVADENMAEQAFKQVCDALGTPDILVNNAGIIRDNLAMRMKAADFRDVLDTNLTG
ncbi:MAG: SDR family NAD(P)-dependent oxidoreductase, partial [Clostridia bacterium]|nr:SDR family NAD(P)-dependent oxidoreductase [Clostridia bacterium]